LVGGERTGAHCRAARGEGLAGCGTEGTTPRLRGTRNLLLFFPGAAAADRRSPSVPRRLSVVPLRDLRVQRRRRLRDWTM